MKTSNKFRRRAEELADTWGGGLSERVLNIIALAYGDGYIDGMIDAMTGTQKEYTDHDIQRQMVKDDEDNELHHE